MSTIEEKRTRTKQLNGAQILVQALVRHGVEYVFAYPGGASMPLHQALVDVEGQLRTILPRHEQGGSFAAQGVARTTGKPSVCMATSGPGATNLVTAIADAKMDSIPIIAITGQVPQHVIGTDAFQETPIVEVCRAITKHHYLITDIKDVARIVNEAFHIATSGRPGPILIDFPKDVQLETLNADEVDFDPPFQLPGYQPQLLTVEDAQIQQVIAAIRRSKRPVIYAGGGIINGEATEELYEFATRTGIPVAMTAMGLGAFPGEHPQSLMMLGMHGTVYSNYAINEADLLLALGVRFDDRVTGKLDEFAKHGKIVHVDIDPSELHKNKEAHIPIVAHVKTVLQKLNAALTEEDLPQLDAWSQQIQEWKQKFPLAYADTGERIISQFAIEQLWKQTKDQDPIITTGVGQHQMWTTQFFKFAKPRRFLSSLGLGTMGFGLPAAMGAQVAFPDKLVIDIDGDGSFQMNIQELGTLRCEELPVKVLLLNNQHLGMVVQWEDRFLAGRRAHTYLGHINDPEAKGAGDGTFEMTYPDFVTIAEGYGVEARRVTTRTELPDAIEEMIQHPKAFVLDVVCCYQEHVLPMVPSGGTVRDIIIE